MLPGLDPAHAHARRNFDRRVVSDSLEKLHHLFDVFGSINCLNRTFTRALTFAIGALHVHHLQMRGVPQG